MKKATALFCTLLIISSLFACGKEEVREETTSEITATEEITAPVSTTEAITETTAEETATAGQETTTKQAETTLKTEITEETAEDETLSDKMIDRINSIYRKSTTGPQEVRTVNELAIVTSINAARKVKGPIGITPALLNGEEITLITLGGTEFKKGQATTVKESKLASEGKTNDYLKAVLSLIKDGTVPGGKPVLITGISLGGMIAQQLIGAKELLLEKGIEIRGIITFGSPFTKPYDRQDIKIVRFADEHDMVPKLGEMPLYGEFGKVSEMKKAHEKERILKSGKYKKPLETHALSYIEDECWSGTDFFGSTKKENLLVLKSDMVFYAAPSLS